MDYQKINVDFEKAVRLLCQYAPVADENSRKPMIPHDIRVGVYLYERNYSNDIILAGVLHDMLEFTKVSKQDIEDEFGKNVLKLVSANTRDDSIADKQERAEEMIMRCVKNGQDALIVKAADIIDSFKYYSSVNNIEQLQNHCMQKTDLIINYLPENFDDPIFDELKQWREKFKK